MSTLLYIITIYIYFIIDIENAKANIFSRRVKLLGNKKPIKPFK